MNKKYIVLFIAILICTNNIIANDNDISNINKQLSTISTYLEAVQDDLDDKIVIEITNELEKIHHSLNDIDYVDNSLTISQINNNLIEIKKNLENNISGDDSNIIIYITIVFTAIAILTGIHIGYNIAISKSKSKEIKKILTDLKNKKDQISSDLDLLMSKYNSDLESTSKYVFLMFIVDSGLINEQNDLILNYLNELVCISDIKYLGLFTQISELTTNQIIKQKADQGIEEIMNSYTNETVNT